jgi:hypothetical protein
VIHQHLPSKPCGGQLVPYLTREKVIITNKYTQGRMELVTEDTAEILERCEKCGLVGYPIDYETSGVNPDW